MSRRCDDARHGRPLEGYDPMASAGGSETHQRTQAIHSRNHGAHADPASSGTCCRWHRQKRRQENDSALRLLFTLLVWKDARPSRRNDVQLGTLALEASVGNTIRGAGTFGNLKESDRALPTGPFALACFKGEDRLCGLLCGAASERNDCSRLGLDRPVLAKFTCVEMMN
jgi:hypothetical protein